MRKILATLALLLGAFQILSAIPAYPGKIRVTQPDGSVISIRIHGDEYFHYITDDSGRVVARGADGFYRPVDKPTQEQRQEAAEMRRSANLARQSMAKASSLTQGTRRIPVVLVNFSDKEFVINDPQTAFSNMLNQDGYSANGGTGSVHDYYYENSHGAYDPVFEVFGPVTLSKDSEYYAYNKTGKAGEALREACGLLDDQIDFSRYDSDNDGAVDMILMYYAGYNQAEGGGESTIWPHQGYTSGRFDEKRLGRYFCTSELRGYTGSRMCGIGTTSHEFGHSLGLPDFYDTDYEDNGEAGALYSFSMMCGGSYNNNGCTPPYLNSEELLLLGWGNDQVPVTQLGEMTLEPIQDSGIAYRTETTMEGEYFVYECRTKTGWDRYIPSGGLLVYHVDKADRESLKPSDYWASYYTPSRLWSDWTSTNAINAFGSHPCFYLIPSASQQSLNYTGRESYIPFPGGRIVRTYTPVDWAGEQGDYRFTDIAFDGSQVTMTVHLMAMPGVQGTVRNTSAQPIRGATVSLYPAGSASAPAKGRLQVKRRVTGTPLMSVTTENDGTYSFEDESFLDGTFTLVVTCGGYVQAEAEVAIGRRIETQDFYLRKVDEPEERSFIKYDPEGQTYYGFGYGNADYNLSAGIHLTAEETAAYAGKQIKTISFQPFGSESSIVEDAYVFIESGGTRVFKQKVESVRFDGMNTVSVVAQEFLIPGNTEIYIGYGLVGCNEAYPLLVQPCAEENAGYLAEFNQNRANSWSLMEDGDGAFYTPVLSASVGEPVQPELGFNHIANPGNGTYAAGDRFDLALVRYADDTPSSVSWTFDGQAVQADAVTLTAGAHAVEAHLTYPDGSVEVIRLVINAE